MARDGGGSLKEEDEGFDEGARGVVAGAGEVVDFGSYRDIAGEFKCDEEYRIFSDIPRRVDHFQIMCSCHCR